MFIAALFTIAKIWKQPKCPSADEWDILLWNGILVSHKKKEILLLRLSYLKRLTKNPLTWNFCLCSIGQESVTETPLPPGEAGNASF